MTIVYSCAASHAPGISAWAEAAPQDQRERLAAAYGVLRDDIAKAEPDAILLLTSEHWANFFLDHIGAFCLGRAAHFDGPIEPWLKVGKAKLKGDPDLAAEILDHCYGNDFELSYSHEMKLDHGTMVPLSFILPAMDRPIVPLMFNTLATPRASAKRCYALGQTLRTKLESHEKRIAVVATGGLSHDPGELNHGVIDTAFDKRFMDRVASADRAGLMSYTDAELLAAGAGTLELLAWICLAGLMGDTRAQVVAYEPVKAWATGMGVVTYNAA